MITIFTLLYAVLALIGGAAGAYLTKARIGLGMVVAAIGFVASCVAQLSGATMVVAFIVFVVAAVLAAFALKLRPPQIAAVVVATVVVSAAGGFVGGFAEGLSSAWSHAAKK